VPSLWQEMKSVSTRSKTEREGKELRKKKVYLLIFVNLLGQDESRCNRCIMHVISVMVWVVVGIVPTFVAFQFIFMHLWRGYKQNSTVAKDKLWPRKLLPSPKILHPNLLFHFFHPFFFYHFNNY